MSAAFTREESAETVADVDLPDRPISPHPKLVTVSGLEALTNAMREGHTAYDAAQRIEDATERRRAVAVASRDTRYFADRLRTALLVPPPADFGAVAFGHRVTFRRGDGRRQAFRIVGEDEADPRNSTKPLFLAVPARPHCPQFSADFSALLSSPVRGCAP
jgi:transcription elongation GreA/GreB family factor